MDSLIDAMGQGLIVSLPLRCTQISMDIFFSIFKCEQCGDCCRDRFDYNEFTEDELEQIKTDLPKGGRSLFKKVGDLYRLPIHPCPFYSKRRGCTIHSKRPALCRQYPLMPPVNGSPYNLAAHTACPGACKAIRKIYKLAKV